MKFGERLKLVINFTDFINNNISLFDGMYNLFKNGEGKLIFTKYDIDLKATNFDKIKKPNDIFFTTMLLMYLSMKQMENPNIDEITIKENEMLEVANIIEYFKLLPEFKNYVEIEQC